MRVLRSRFQFPRLLSEKRKKVTTTPGERESAGKGHETSETTERLLETPDARLFRRKRVRDRVFRGEIPKVPQPTVIRLILPSLRVTPPPPSTFRGPPAEMEFRAGVRAEYQTDGGRYLDGTQPRKSRRISITRGRALVLSALSSPFFSFLLLLSFPSRRTHTHLVSRPLRRYDDLSLARRISHGRRSRKIHEEHSAYAETRSSSEIASRRCLLALARDIPR